MLETSSDYIIIMTDVEGSITAWLGAAERIFGFTAEEAVGMNISRTFVPEDVAGGLDRHERELAIAAGSAQNDRWHQRRDGSRFWGSGIMMSLRDEAGHPVALAKIMRDRTDVRSQIEALQNRLAAAEGGTESRRNFIVSTAHEMRNQVAPIMTSAALLAGSDDPAVRAKAVAVIQRQARLMSTLLNDLSESVLPGDRLVRLEPVRMTVQQAVRDAAHAFADAVAERRQTLKVTLPEEPIHIEADPTRLAQILSNLLSNAVKYTPDGGNIQLSATAESDMAVIRVEDNGRGISGDVLPHIFELFTRETRTEGPSGLGVGLNVVKQWVTAHGGMIEARSPGVGKGSMFSVRLPLPRNERIGAAPPSAP